MKVLNHQSQMQGNTGFCLYHRTLVEATDQPDVVIVADICGYPTLGYGMTAEQVVSMGHGRYQVSWYSSPNLL